MTAIFPGATQLAMSLDINSSTCEWNQNNFGLSDLASLSRDEVVRCIEQRATFAQPWNDNMMLEPFDVQRYQKDGFFSLHHDTLFADGTLPNRKTTITAYLYGNCTGGGTHFPYIPRSEDPRHCEFIDCESELEGTVFKPIAGNAIFWENVNADIQAYDQTLHQSLPLESGTKIGVSIWSWQMSP